MTTDTFGEFVIDRLDPNSSGYLLKAAGPRPGKSRPEPQEAPVTFEEAASLFGDPLAFTFADPDHSIDEDRWLMFGLSQRARILAVVYTQRRGTYRTISSRLATRHERKIYEEE